MTFLTPTQVQCPACGRPFPAQLEQIVDVGSDPTGKQRLLSGRLNVATCPLCGSRGMVSTPLLYHDPAHDLMLIYVPTELNLPQNEREQLIGGLSRDLMTRIPMEARKGYLFAPQMVLTMEGLVDRILSADGIPPEVVADQRRRSQLISRLLAASEPELESLVKAHDDEIDEGIFQMLAAMIDSARREGGQDQEQTKTLIQLRNRLLPLASWSRGRGITPKMLDEQQVRLEMLERFLAAEESGWPDLAQQHDQDLDYQFFQLLTAVAGGAPEETAAKLHRLRDQLVEHTTAGRDVQARQAAVEGLKTAADAAGGLGRETLLQQIISADGDAAVEALALAGGPLMDYSFFLLLADKIDAAHKKSDKQEAARLSTLRSRLVAMTEEWEKASRLHAERVYGQIEDLLRAEDREAALNRLLPEIDESFLALLAGRREAAHKAGQEETATRLELLMDQVLAHIKASAPPEIQLMNDLLELEDDAAIRQMLDRRSDELTPALLAAMEQMLENLRSDKRETLAGRMAVILELAQQAGAGATDQAAG